VTHLVWEHLCWGADGAGLEHLVVESSRGDGVIVWIDEQGRRYRLEYEVEWDERWVFGRIGIVLTGEAVTTLELARDAGGRWHRDGVAAHDLEGCTEVDLWPTPFTNSLPIGRLQLEPDSAATIAVAHVVAPELTVTRRPQRYSNLGGGVYRFEGLDDGFAADLTVDEAGLVVDYPGLFRRRLSLG
jgi:hypothetical protein